MFKRKKKEVLPEFIIEVIVRANGKEHYDFSRLEGSEYAWYGRCDTLMEAHQRIRDLQGNDVVRRERVWP